MGRGYAGLERRGGKGLPSFPGPFLLAAQRSPALPPAALTLPRQNGEISPQPRVTDLTTSHHLALLQPRQARAGAEWVSALQPQP